MARKSRKKKLKIGRDDGWTSAPRTGPHPLAPAVPYLLPFLLAGALWPVGLLAHTLLGGHGWTTGLYCMVIAACGAVTGLVLHLLAAARTWYADLTYTAGCAGATLWLIVATAWTPWMPAAGFYLVIAGFLAAMSAAHRALAGSEEEGHAAKPSLPTWSQVAAWIGMDGVTMRTIKKTDTQLKGKLALTPGQTLEEIQTQAPAIASAYGVAPGAVRIAQDPARADQGDITIVTRDVMGHLIPWPGVKDPGTSIADAPLELGLYEDGETFTVNPINNHSLTVGMAGAGKSVYGKIKLVSIAARRDTFVVAIDLAKGKQTLGPVTGAIGWPILNDKKGAKAGFAALQRAVKARADYLGERGLAQWEPGCGLTFVHVLLEEAAELVDFTQLVELVRAARSTGIHVELSLQRATHGNLDTDARANLGDGICFGVRDEADADYVLPDYVTESGADPSRWRKSRPGAAYAAVDSQDPDRHTIPIKMYGPPSTDPGEENRDLQTAADSLGDQDAKLDSITRAAFGQAYTDHLAQRHTAAVPAATEQAAVVRPAPPIALADAHSTDEENEEEHEILDEEDETVMTDEDLYGDEPDLLVRDEDQVEAVTDEDPLPDPNVDFDLPAPKRSREAAEDARARLEVQLQSWTAQGITEFTPIELRTAMTDSQGLNRHRTWYKRQLERLEEEGTIVFDDGKYRIATPELAAV